MPTQVRFFFLFFYLFNSLSRSEHHCRYVFFFSSFFICLIPCIEVNAKATTGAIDAGMYLFIFFLFIYLIPCIEVNAHAGTFFIFFFFIYLLPCIKVNANAGTAGAINAGMYIYISFVFI